MLAIAAAHAQK